MLFGGQPFIADMTAVGAQTHDLPTAAKMRATYSARAVVPIVARLNCIEGSAGDAAGSWHVRAGRRVGGTGLYGRQFATGLLNRQFLFP